MNRPRSQLAIAAVAFLLGLLVVVQLRAQTGGSALENLSATDLTTLIANLNTRNDQLQAEVSSLEAEQEQLSTQAARGETSVGQLASDLARIRAWAGLSAVSGPGIRITVSGALPASGVADLLNELRNSGAEAIGVEGVRVVPGVVVGGQPGALSVLDTPLADPVEIDAIGGSEVLTGSLTRSGGIVQQLAATYPSVQVTVTPIDRLLIPATRRSLLPTHGSPTL